MKITTGGILKLQYPLSKKSLIEDQLKELEKKEKILFLILQRKSKSKNAKKALSTSTYQRKIKKYAFKRR